MLRNAVIFMEGFVEGKEIYTIDKSWKVLKLNSYAVARISWSSLPSLTRLGRWRLIKFRSLNWTVGRME